MKRSIKMTALVLSALIGVLPLAAGTSYASGTIAAAGISGLTDPGEKKATPSELTEPSEAGNAECGCAGCPEDVHTDCTCEACEDHGQEERSSCGCVACTGHTQEPGTAAETAGENTGTQELLPPGTGKISTLAIRSGSRLKSAGLLGATLTGSVADWQRCNISASFNGSNVVLSFDLDYYAGGGGTKFFAPRLSINPTPTFYGRVVQWLESPVPSGGNLGTLNVASYNRTMGTSEGERHLTFNATFVIAADKLSEFNTNGLLNVYAGGWGDGFWAYGNFEIIPTGWAEAYAQATCSHSYNRYEAVDASTHRLVCSKCGIAARTESHDSNTADTTSRPGYTIRKCSKCGYTVSTTANRYTVTLSQSGATTPGTGSITATYGAAMPAITVPKRTGYAFMGYFTGQNGTGTKYYTETSASARAYANAGALTLYANWVRTYEVTKTDNLKNAFGILGT